MFCGATHQVVDVGDGVAAGRHDVRNGERRRGQADQRERAQPPHDGGPALASGAVRAAAQQLLKNRCEQEEGERWREQEESGIWTDSRWLQDKRVRERERERERERKEKTGREIARSNKRRKQKKMESGAQH